MIKPIADGSPYLGLGQEQNKDRVKRVNGIPILHILTIGSVTVIQI
jgi:hypothetical protein